MRVRLQINAKITVIRILIAPIAVNFEIANCILLPPFSGIHIRKKKKKGGNFRS